MRLRIHRQSIILISLSAFIIILVLANIVFIYVETRRMENDGNIINETGVVRGSIQRIVKKELAGYRADEEIARVEGVFRSFETSAPGYDLRGISRELEHILDSLRASWEGLQETVREYRASPSERNRLRLYNESEAMWDRTDRTVFLAKTYSEQKLRFFRLVFVVFGVNLAALFLVVWVVRYRVAGKLERDAHFDTLTGAYNKNTFNDLMSREMERSRRSGAPLSIIALDLDHFKRVNDTYGHKTGDRVLQNVSRIVKKQIRLYDLFCRTGGEEFIILMGNTDLTQATLSAERIRRAVEGSDFVPRTSLSLGVAEYEPAESSEEFFARADRALYEAKAAGRNLVRVG